MGYSYRILKIGGSLITCKDLPRCIRLDILSIIIADLKRFILENPNVKIILLHGGGSFGHYEASIHDDMRTSRTSEAMQELNYIVTKSFLKENIRVVSVPGKFYSFEIVMNALNNSLIPLIYGDIKFDGSIISADDISVDIAKRLDSEVLYAIDKEGVIGKDGLVLRELRDLNDISILKNENYDVTGGIFSKIKKILENNIDAKIFDGSKAGNIYLALKGYNIGTLVRGRLNA
ncbi:MAG: uridylate kinase [Saccharolobus sp.]|uniref:amino acid kinase family protein n=1 Tax=Saccharolobus sp. TaxID=2100761 RepID=UPI0028CEC3D6|nr:uridylate kinase [Saccharolobus sp.]MDT7861868.1 uridylate kinase [Saccharolobus sp.]